MTVPINPLKINRKIGTVTFFWAAALIGVTFLVFAQVLRFDFVNWDDPLYVYDNPVIRSFQPIQWFKPVVSLYVPIPLASYALDYFFYHDWAGGYHLTNLLIHAANAALLYALFNLFFKDRLVSFLGALLFAVHPAQAESVAWVSERKNVFLALFFLSGFLCLARGPRKRWGAALVFLALALLSKITAVVIPFVWMAYEMFSGQGLSNRRRIAYVLGIAICAAAGAATLLLYPGLADLYRSHGWRIAAHQLAVFSTYVQHAFFPVGLVPVDSAPIGSAASYHPGMIGTGALMLMGSAVVAAVFPKARFWVLWAILFLLPVSSLFAVPVADRHLYLPLAGLIGAMLSLLSRWRRFLIWLLAGLNLLCLPLVYRQTRIWKDSEALWTYVLAKIPSHSFARIQLADHYRDVGRAEDAIRIYEDMIRREPRAVDAYRSLIPIYFDRGEPKEANRLIEQMNRHLSDHPDTFFIGAMSVLKRWDTDQAEELLDRAIRMGTQNPGVYHLLGIIQFRKGKFEAAVPFLTQAISMNERQYHARYHLGLSLAALGRWPEALSVFDRMIRDRIPYPGVYFQKGYAHLKMGQREQAEIAYLESVRRDPQITEAHAHLGLLKGQK